MGNKIKEEQCIDRVLRCIPKENTKALNFYNTIKNILPYKQKNCERPDFIFKKDNFALGIEHCLVDGLYNQFDDSFNRTKDSNIEKTVNDYKKNKDLDKGTDALKRILTENFNAMDRFEYNNFIKIFNYTCSEHNGKCYDSTIPGYRSNLKTYALNYVLGCMIEIPLQETTKDYVLKRNGKEHIQRINRFPYTKDIIDILKSMTGFNFIIVCAYCRYFTDVKYFDTKDIDNSIKEQKINLYDSFDYNFPFSVDSVDFKKGQDEYTLVCSGKIKQR